MASSRMDSEARPEYTWCAARRRLRHFGKLSEEHQNEYNQILNDWLQAGIIEKASPVGGSYLPHHAVTGKKMRVGLDGSAKMRGNKAINELLDVGSAGIMDLAAVVGRFRQ